MFFPALGDPDLKLNTDRPILSNMPDVEAIKCAPLLCYCTTTRSYHYTTILHY